MKTVGVFEIFDEWERYDNKAIVDTALYLVRDSPSLNSEQRLILHAEINLLDGRTLKVCTKWPNFKPSQIIQVVYPSKLGELTVASELKALWDSDLPLEHKKFIPNKIVGQLGKRYNKRSNTTAFQNQAEAEYYYDDLKRNTRGAVTILKRPLGARKIYFVNETDSRDLVDGFYPIQLAIYNQMRVALYEKVIEIKARGGVIQGVKADAVFEKGRGNEMEILKTHSYAAMGTWSLKN